MSSIMVQPIKIDSGEALGIQASDATKALLEAMNNIMEQASKALFEAVNILMEAARNAIRHISEQQKSRSLEFYAPSIGSTLNVSAASPVAYLPDADARNEQHLLRASQEAQVISAKYLEEIAASTERAEQANRVFTQLQGATLAVAIGTLLLMFVMFVLSS